MASDKENMSFDSVVTNPGRLRILTALAVEERQEFVQLRRTTQLTDGNLSAHARRLETAGLVGIDKQFRAGKPVTSFVLTSAGRAALEAHTRRLLAAISHRRIASPTTDASHVAGDDDAPDRVKSTRSTTATMAQAAVVRPSIRNPLPEAAPLALAEADVLDDWVD